MGLQTILAVDDEEHILELIGYNLEAAGYSVQKAETGEMALEILRENEVDLVLLDWMLPGMDGIDVIRALRMEEKHRNLPIILLTAKNEEINKVVGLEVGADDFLCKPFGVHELLARIKAVLRRSTGRGEQKKEDNVEVIHVHGLSIDKERRTVLAEGHQVDLSLKEFELLYYLAKNRDIVYSRDRLLEKIWGYDFEGETRTVDVHISNLRKKIEKDDANPEIIKTVRGVGYKLV
ncbi:MAG: response regulator transcription factor [Acetivibrio sp.]